MRILLKAFARGGSTPFRSKTNSSSFKLKISIWASSEKDFKEKFSGFDEYTVFGYS